MSDIRINALTTTAASSASDDYLPIDGSANGTRKLSAYSPTFGGNLTVSGTTTIASNTWLNSSDGKNRIYPGTNSTLFYQGHGSGVNHEFRNSGNTAILQLTNALDATLAGNLTVSGTGTSSVAGNLGMGATPSAWQSSIYRVIEFPYGVSLSGQTDAASMELATNAYINSSFLWTYKTTAEATRYRQNGGEHRFFVAPSGTAGTEPSFTQAVTLKNNGNLLVGTTTDGGYKLRVNGSIASDDVITMLKSGGNSTNVDGNFGQVIARTNTGNIGFACALANNGDYGGFTIATPSQSRSVAFLGSNGTAYIQTNNGSTALTLDSSQNATFANKVTINKSNDIGLLVNAGAGYALASLQSQAGNKAYLRFDSDTEGVIQVQTTAVLSFAPTTGNATFAGNIKTAAPSGGTAATWRLGTVASVSPTSPNRTIEVEIGGTTYYIHAKTTND